MWAPQAPQGPWQNVCDNSVFPALDSAVSHRLRERSTTVAPIPEIAKAVQAEWNDHLSSPAIARGFVLVWRMEGKRAKMRPCPKRRFAHENELHQNISNDFRLSTDGIRIIPK